MTPPVRRAVTVMLICSLGPLAAATATAQQAEGTPPAGPDESLAVEASEIFASFDTELAELERIRDRLGTASDVDRDALVKRAFELLPEALADLEALADNVARREKQGLDAAADRSRVLEQIDRASMFFRREIGDSEGELERLRASLEDAAPEDREAIDNRLATENARLDRMLDLLLGLTDAMATLELPGEDERAFLADALVRRADLISGQILLERDRIARLQKRASADPANSGIATELDVAAEHLDRLVDRLQTTTRTMKPLGLDTADYEQLLFEVTGEITTGLLSREVMAGLVKGWAATARDWLVNSGPALVLKIVVFVLILVAFRILSRIARKVVRKAIHTSTLRVSQLLERTALSVTGSVVMIFGLLVALSQLGIEVGPLLAGLGVVGFIVGFALQDTLSNFASGVMILLYRPYDEGDLIETAGAFGKVSDMSLVSTTILTLDHQTLVIPNSKIWGDVIKNVTAQTERRIDMVFGIGYADDIPHAERVLREIVEAHPKVLDEPAPNVKLHTLGESSVDFIVRPWVATEDYWEVYWDITREVKIRFDAEGISIPFPQRDVHLHQAAPADPRRTNEPSDRE